MAPEPTQTPWEPNPVGMTPLVYPSWVSKEDPHVENQMTAVVAELYKLFGTGVPAASKVAEFPFTVETGEGSGIAVETYKGLQDEFRSVKQKFDQAAADFDKAIASSAAATEVGRNAINDAISTFNSKTGVVPEGQWSALIQLESDLIDSARAAVKAALAQEHNVPMPPAYSLVGVNPSKRDSRLDALLDKLDGRLGMGNPLGANPLGGLNPLGAMNPLGGGAPAGGAGTSPLPGVGNAVKPLTQLGDNAAEDKPEPSVTPVSHLPANPPPPLNQSGQQPPGAPNLVEQQKPATPPAAQVEPAAHTRKHIVTLPDGQTTEAPNEHAREAAQNAVDNASPGGDAARKAYDGLVDFPGDGKNIGAKVDPDDMAAGDVLQWKDKTMVAAGPGLVADPEIPGKVHALADVLKDSNGFEGIFRPTAEDDPTLSTHTTLPPILDVVPAASPSSPPADPPPSDTTIPLTGTPTPAPPSPFDQQHPPAAMRSTKQERIAAGQSSR